MSEEVYRVVFEYLPGVSFRGVSLAGHRFIEIYPNKEEFEKSSYLNKNVKPIAVGVTEIETDRIKRHLDDIVEEPIIKEIMPNLVQDNSVKNE